MNLTPAEITGSAAGVSRPQVLGSELDRMRLAAAELARSRQARQQAEQAAGVGRTPDNPQVSDRDADGRQGWILPAPSSPDELARQDTLADDGKSHARGSSDLDDPPGTRLDISG